MWTPKRLFLLFFGFVIFFAAYEVYAQFLGKYDGLPPLPAEHFFVAGPDNGSPVHEAKHPMKNTDLRLLQAFGSPCEEIQRLIRMGWRKENIYISADAYKITDDGKLLLHKVSIAMFGKPRPDAKDPEINTARGDEAVIEFDKPIKTFAEYTGRKPVAGKLTAKEDNGVELRNNRRTGRLDDDLRFYTKWLAYNDAKHLVWTDAPVQLFDSNPPVRQMTATGMELLMNVAPPVETNPAAPANKAKPHAGGAKQLKFLHDVQMNMQIDAGAGFPGMGPPPAAAKANKDDKKAAPAEKGEKSRMTVSAVGPFIYDFGFFDPQTDRAEFTGKVEVLRSHPAPPRPDGKPSAGNRTMFDDLHSDKLVLKLHQNEAEKPAEDKKPAAKPSDKPTVKPSEEPADKTTLVSIQANGKEVVLNSEAEALHAVGVELLYENLGEKQARTTLRGGPNVYVVKEGNIIEAKGTLVMENKDKDVQAALIRGPGTISMNGRQPPPAAGKESKGTASAGPAKDQPGKARWQKELRMNKDGKYDHLVLVGQASFEDAEARTMTGEELSVWLEPASEKRTDEKKGQPLPKRVLAVGHVFVHSVAPPLNVKNADRLALEFEDAPPTPKNGTAGEAPKGSASWTPMAKSATGPAQPMEPAKTAGEKGPAAPGKPAEVKKPKPPMELIAGLIEVKILRRDGKSELKDLYAENNVEVTQTPAGPEDKAVHILGSRLKLARAAEGDILQVFGAPTGEPAYVKLDTLEMVGPDVLIDQRQNIAEVKGMGSMKRPLTTDLEGNKLKQPSEVVIHWKDRMFFDGRVADFSGAGDAGGVQAEQGPSRLICQRMQVLFKQPISMKEKNKASGEQDAIARVVTGDVLSRFTKEEFENGKWKYYQKIECPEIAFYKQEEELHAKGPQGVVRLFQPGSKQDTFAGPPKKPETPGTPKAEQEMKLTHIEYDGSMVANKLTGIVTFRDNVNLIHLPADDPEMDVKDLNRLPPRSIHLTCGMMKIQEFKPTLGPIGTTTPTHDFEATDKVAVESEKFHARADRVTYDEAKDYLILEGKGSNLATVWQQKTPGGPRQPMQGRKLGYYLKTDQCSIIDGQSFEMNFDRPQSERPGSTPPKSKGDRVKK